MSSHGKFVRAEPSSARVALIDVSDEAAHLLHDCMARLRIQAVPLGGIRELALQKYEGCVIDLRRDDAEELLEAVRSSGRNRRAVLFGIYSHPSELRRASKYVINGLLAYPFRRSDAIKVLRSTQTLLMHELRRYARIPLAAEIEVAVNHSLLRGVSRDLSGGGMSVQFSQAPNIARHQQARASFQIAPGKAVSLKGVVSWVHEPERLMGIEFVPKGEDLKTVRNWIEDYLGMA